MTWGKCQSGLLSTMEMIAKRGGPADALADRAATQSDPDGPEDWANRNLVKLHTDKAWGHGVLLGSEPTQQHPGQYSQEHSQ